MHHAHMLRLVRAVLAVRGDHVTLGRLRRGSVFSFVCVAGFCFFDYGAGEKSNPTGAFVAVRRFVARYLLETLKTISASISLSRTQFLLRQKYLGIESVSKICFSKAAPLFPPLNTSQSVKVPDTFSLKRRRTPTLVN